ncbi:TRAP transporter substrate-binding protein [Roseinatronobacter alkalisoli]|uniref:TRAP transporter substrate-binding protein DctP n=1 Tax=Roseinatronobacter alkalisoli TaxID=3028235 RepID=A0ABT5TC57_9RHOB|nr:TRAP transporter substrate-binding protein DctP [Roseinatronobacter sp. HJB301]MDD7972712.1 TRAP transporter substrate-binding protein DctP [Roseinatronobacter sp. HJB301]
MAYFTKTALTTGIITVLGLGMATAQEFRLTYASPYGPTHPYGEADQAWIDRIHEQTEGRVEITPFWGRSLITSREGVDELAAGVADIAYIAPIYASSGYELSRLTPSFFYGYEDALEVLDVYLELWNEFPQFEQELDGVKVLGFNVGTPMHLMLRDRPFEQVSDLQGLRIRSAVDYISALAGFGAEGVTMPMTDTYPALERGVVDGVIAPYEALRSLSFAEVINYYSELPHSRGAYPSRAMNGGVWARLPADIQQVFEDNILWLTTMTYELAEGSEDAGRAYGEEMGVTFNTVDESVIIEYSAAFAQPARETAERLDAAGMPGTEILNRVRAGRD